MPTPHISAESGDFAPRVLMPGDPRRARLIAERYFDDARLVTEVRGILGYTGTYRGEPISVLASGMGMPSMSIYATELIRHYGVTRIVRTGTMGGAQDHLRIGDVVAVSSAHTDSAMSQLRVPGVNISHAPTFSLLRAAVEYGEQEGKPLHVGSAFTTDAFYQVRPEIADGLVKIGILGIEMEAAGLYAIAAAEGVESLTLCTISDHVYKEELMSAEERENRFDDIMGFALAAVTA